MLIINNIINNNTIINCMSTICNSSYLKSVEMETIMQQWNLLFACCNFKTMRNKQGNSSVIIVYLALHHIITK